MENLKEKKECTAQQLLPSGRATGVHVIIAVQK
jgi:DNA segregation ATPase FtsK/SpoIIIE-like protein